MDQPFFASLMIAPPNFGGADVEDAQFPVSDVFVLRPAVSQHNNNKERYEVLPQV
jgi:hypothetical protein